MAPSVRIFENPTLEEAADVAKESIRKHNALVIVGNCCVEYEGRASSKLQAGERILIIKKDGALLVHRPDGYEPVNWMPGDGGFCHISVKKDANLQNKIPVNRQPSGCIYHTRKRNDTLVVKAIRRKPRETITIYFDRVYLVSALSLIDEGEFSLHASEEDMQKAILLQPSIVEEGLRPITYEKKVEPGFIDVYGIDKDGKMVVIEIKRKTAGKEAALQLAKYVESLRNTVNREVRGMLVAPQIAKGVQKLLVTLGLDFKRLDPKRCTKILREVETRKLADFF